MASQKKTGRRIAVFGSAFNPPHCGHRDVVMQALAIADTVILVPSYRHAFGKEMAPYEQRVMMTEALAFEIRDLGDIQVSHIEQSLAMGSDGERPIYTYDVLQAIEASYPNSSLAFVLGPDNADPRVWRQFYRADDILRRWSTWEAKERVAVRSTIIRQKLARGVMPTALECPTAVINLLEENNYYRDGN